MRWRLIIGIASGVAALLVVAGAAWILSLPPTPPGGNALPVTAEETDALQRALRPRRPRPLIAILGINDATETTDYLMPYGILRRADVADVVALATAPGPVTLYPALTVLPDATTEAFDAAHPDGADYVVVPAMSRDDDPAALAWIRAQAAKGATILSVCAGAKVVAEAGLLDGRRATTHWYYLNKMRERHPSIRYVPDRRFVVDDGVATTTGITASTPMMLTLIEAIAGRTKAEAVASDLGLATWDATHDSGAFRFNRAFALTVIGNTMAFWNRETFAIELEPDFDEVSLALLADAWSRTYRSHVEIVATEATPQTSRNGLRIIPDRTTAHRPANALPSIAGRTPAAVLDTTLGSIAQRYGTATADIVAMQLEYPKDAGPR